MSLLTSIVLVLASFCWNSGTYEFFFVCFVFFEEEILSDTEALQVLAGSVQKERGHRLYSATPVGLLIQ